MNDEFPLILWHKIAMSCESTSDVHSLLCAVRTYAQFVRDNEGLWRELFMRFGVRQMYRHYRNCERAVRLMSERPNIVEWPSTWSSMQKVEWLARNGFFNVFRYFYYDEWVPQLDERCERERDFKWHFDARYHNRFILVAAATGGHLNIVRYALDELKQDYSDTAALSALREGHLDVLREFMQRKFFTRSSLQLLRDVAVKRTERGDNRRALKRCLGWVKRRLEIKSLKF